MKYTKLVTLVSTLLLGSVAVSGSVFAAETASYDAKGLIEFEAGEDPTNPVDPENPDPEIPVTPIDPIDPEGPNPGTAGPLSIDYASSLSFGKNKITNKNATYFANAQELKLNGKSEFRGNYVQITDKRGTLDGWTLTVKQTGQFASEAAKKAKVLTGAQLKLSNAVAESVSEFETKPTVKNVVLDPSGAEQFVMSAKDGEGEYTWVTRYGNAETMNIEGEAIQKNKAVTLDVPGKTSKEAVQYLTKLVWSLSDTPGN